MVKSAVRVFSILRFIADAADGCTHADIGRALNIPRASLSALLSDLCGLGYAELDPRTRRYTLGAALLTLSHAYLKHLNLVQLGEPLLRQVFRETGEFVSLVILKDGAVVKVCEFAPPDPLGSHLQVGESGPPHATAAGKVLLANLPVAMRDAAIARIDLRVYTARTLHTRKALLRELATVRSGGVAYSREEYLAGMISMAMPVFNAADQAVAAMGVNTPRVRFTPSHERKVGRILRWASSEMSARLGHRPSLLARATAADRHDTAANRQARTPVAEAGRRMRQTERRSTR